MSIRIETKKIVTDKNEYAYKVKKIYALSKEELPEAYLNQAKHVYYEPSSNSCLCSYWEVVLGENKIYRKEVFEKKLDEIAECGEELKRINEEIEEKKKNWQGDETFII